MLLPRSFHIKQNSVAFCERNYSKMCLLVPSQRVDESKFNSFQYCGSTVFSKKAFYFSGFWSSVHMAQTRHIMYSVLIVCSNQYPCTKTYLRQRENIVGHGHQPDLTNATCKPSEEAGKENAQTRWTENRQTRTTRTTSDSDPVAAGWSKVVSRNAPKKEELSVPPHARSGPRRRAPTIKPTSTRVARTTSRCCADRQENFLRRWC